MPKMGIGIITTQDRPLHVNYLNLLDQKSTTFNIQVDKNRRGIAPTRNRVLKELYDSGCDIITMFDDDTFPIKMGWQTWLMDAHIKSGAGVLSYPIRHETGRVRDGIQLMRWGIGFFQSITRQGVEELGYFNTEYDRYGHEDVAWLARARAAGLSTNPGWDAAPVGVEEYIANLDVRQDLGPNLDTFTRPEKDHLVEKNREIFDREIARNVIYYPYDGGAD